MHKLLYICLISFFTIPCMHGGDVPTPSSGSSADKTTQNSILNPIQKDSNKKPLPFELKKVAIDPDVSLPQEPEQKILTTKKPIDIDLLKLDTFKKNISLAQNLKDIKKIDFSTAIGSSTLIKPIITKKSPDAKVSLPEYSAFYDLLAATLININKAAIVNSEDLLWKTLAHFKSKNKYYRIINMNDLHPKNSLELKTDIFNRYVANFAKANPTNDKIVANISRTIPLFLNIIYEYHELSDNYSSQLTHQTKTDLVKIIQYLKGQNTSLDNSLQLIEEIVTTTTLTKDSIKICLLLLNKVGGFYPEIKSEIAQTIIDGITARYFTLSAQLPSNVDNNELIAQAIQLLAIVPDLEPLFSKTLPISNIADEDLEDYLKKIILLKLASNSSKLVQDTLEKMRDDIQKESDERFRQATIAQQAEQKAIEKAKIKEAKKLRKEEEKKEFLRVEFEKKQLEIEEELKRKEISQIINAPQEPALIDPNIEKQQTVLIQRNQQLPTTNINIVDENDDLITKKSLLYKDGLATLSNKDLVEKIEASALPLLSSSEMSINDNTLEPIFTYTDQLIKNKAATGKDDVIGTHHFIDIAKTIELLRKIIHVLDPEDNNNRNNLNTRIRLLFNNINNRDKDELIKQIKEGKGRFNHAEKSVIKDIINDYYFSSHANSYMEPLFYIKRDILGAIKKMGSEQSSNKEPLPSTQSAVTITEETNISPQTSEIVDKPAEIEPLQSNSTTPVIAEENTSQILPTTDDSQDVNINQTPAFFENLSNSISSWLRWLFSDLWN